jgi:peptide/nickel transport system ATP-binding protein/oligopeptide transport system ATP-binding protein
MVVHRSLLAESGRFELQIEDLSVSYRTNRGLLTAVAGVNLEFATGRIYALVGESGCGKSTLGLSIPRLLPEDQVRYSGKIKYNGINIFDLDEEELEGIRGSGFATIFQEPMTSLNPVYRIGDQIAEALSVKSKRNGPFPAHQPLAKPSPAQRLFGLNLDSSIRYRKHLLDFYPQVYSLLEEVWIPNPKRVANMYPHELSGGMKQRVMIAIALAGKPSFLIADEPTTSLDLTTQAQILNLIKSISDDHKMGVLLITHDLGVVAAVSDYAVVMYAGHIVEEATTSEILGNPLHPYTQGLLASFPKGRKDEYSLHTITGSVPPLGSYPVGCPFHPRCPKAFERCPTAFPETVEVSKGHKVSCYLFGGS